jgi:hypothetical protein
MHTSDAVLWARASQISFMAASYLAPLDLVCVGGGCFHISFHFCTSALADSGAHLVATSIKTVDPELLFHSNCRLPGVCISMNVLRTRKQKLYILLVGNM